MDFNIEHKHCLSEVTISFKEDDTELSSNEIIKVYTPIRKAYIKKYGAAPTLIIGPNHKKGSITITFMGGQHIKDKLTKRAVTTFIEYFEKYSKQHLPIDTFTQKMKEQLEVHDIDIAPIHMSRNWLHNMMRFRQSTASILN